MFTLRPYQKTSADEAIRRLVIFDDDGTLLDLPTGTGKTVIFCAIARRWHRATKTRVLILAHRKNLIYQTRDKLVSGGFFREWECGLEHGGNDSSPLQPIVLSVDKTMGRRMERFNPNDFGLIIIDEAHRVRTATYERITKFFAAKRLGVTATPKRFDDKSLGAIFQTYAYRYKLPDAIQDGWLVPVRTKKVELKTVSFNAVGCRAGDYKRERLSQILRRDKTVEEIVCKILHYSEERPTLIFTVDRKQTRAYFKEIESIRPGAARYADSTIDDSTNERTLNGFLRGEFQYLINCELYTEGTDLPNASCVAMARPTKSWALYMQMLGRGTRLLGATFEESVLNGKEDVLVLDFTDNSVEHSPLCANDVLFEDLDSSGGESQERSKSECEIDEGSEDSGQPAEDAIILSEIHDIDIFTLSPETSNRIDRATDEQVRSLQDFGFSKTKSTKLTLSQAERVVQILRQRENKGLATYRQALQLRRYRLNENMSKDEAKRTIGVIARAGWPSPFSSRFLNLGLV